MDIFNGRDQFKMHVQEKVEKVPPAAADLACNSAFRASGEPSMQRCLPATLHLRPRGATVPGLTISLAAMIWAACAQELIPYGLSVTNANISELRDMPGDDNRYFESLKQKAISGATNNARCAQRCNSRACMHACASAVSSAHKAAELQAGSKAAHALLCRWSGWQCLHASA